VIDPASFASRYDAMIEADSMRALYGDSGYFNVGYWGPGATGLVSACDRLVDELASAVPAGASLIVDAGCGVGAATRRLAGRFPEATILAVNISHWQLVQARRRGVAAPVVMDAARLAIAAAAADAVIAVQSAQLFDTRAAFLAEACRVLRPGGVIALSDLIINDREPGGAWMLPPANAVATIQDYADGLAQAGFVEVEVRDATDACWRPFCALLRTVHAGREEMVDALEASVSHYVLASGRKPY
jgi:SAM-dependent methyltransferase